MRTGDLDTIIEIWTPTEATQSSGQLKKTYAKLISLFANIKYLTGSENFEGDQKVAVGDIVATVYDRMATLDNQCLVRLNSKFYAVESMIPDKTRFYLEIVCKVRDNQNVGL